MIKIFLVLYDGFPDSIFLGLLDAEQYMQLFPEEQRERFDIIELSEQVSDSILSMISDKITYEKPKL